MKDRMKRSFKKYTRWYITAISLLVIMAGAFVAFKVFVRAADDFTFTIAVRPETWSDPAVRLRATVTEHSDIPSSAPNIKDKHGHNYKNYTWMSSDGDAAVYEFVGGNTGQTVTLASKGAGTSDIYAIYHDEVYISVNGAVLDTLPDGADPSTYQREEVNGESARIPITVPLVSRLLHNGSTAAPITTPTVIRYVSQTDRDYLHLDYNGYVEEVIPGEPPEESEHKVEFTYNTNVLEEIPGSRGPKTAADGLYTCDVQFAPVGAGSSEIVGKVDDVEYKIGAKIYVGVKFLNKTEIEVKQGKVFSLAPGPNEEGRTNILSDNFGKQDEEGNYSVYFWTLEDYQREIEGRTDVIQVASVSPSGVITGVYAGKTNLYASCKPMAESYINGALDTSVADFVSVSVPVEFFFEEGDVTVTVGDIIPVKTSNYLGNTVYELVNNENVIDQHNGAKDEYIALKEGTAEVTVTVNYYEYGSLISSIQQRTLRIHVIDKLILSKEEDAINIGSTTTVTATPTCKDPDKGTVLTWTSSDERIAMVTYDSTSIDSSLTATITGVAKGTATITCTQVVNGVVKIATMKITVMVPVTGITLSKPDPGRDHWTLYLNETGIITAYLAYDNDDVPDNTELIWTVSGPEIITLNPVEPRHGVQQSCEITATQLGQTTLTVYSKDNNQIVTCDIFVTEQPVSITLSDTDVLSAMSLKEYQLKATVEAPNGGADQTVIWESLDKKVCTVDPETGLVTFVAPGVTYIRATSAVDRSVYADCRFEIMQDVNGIILDKTSLTMKVGDTYRLTASVNPADAYNKSMEWTSSNPAVVTVENTDRFENLLTATGSGSATIFAKTNDGGYIAYCNVRVLQPVTGLTLNQTEMTVRKGTEFYLNATVTPDTADNKTIVWTTNDANIATVSNDGKVTTVNVGQCIITATNPDSEVSVSCTVIVLEPITGLRLNTYYQNMVKDTKFVLVPIVEPDTASNKAVTFWSSDENVATVDENGVVTAVNGGVCDIVVTTVESSFIATCTIAVKEYVSSITLTDEFKYLNRGSSYTMSAVVERATATDKGIIWSTSNDSVVTVNQYGVISGIAYGTAIITATAADGSGVSDSCVVQVIKPVESITLDKSKVTMYVGDVIHIGATVNPPDASVQKLSWTSSDPTIAKVYDDGDVEAVSVGRCKIYATSTDGNNIVAECTIIVKQIVNATSITINSHEILMLTGKMRTLTARAYPINSSESVRWLSTDTSVVVVDNNGQITTVGPGSCEVIAYTTLGSVEDRCTVYSMAISKSSLTLEQYDTFNLYVDGAPSAASWRSSNPRIATVTRNGIVTGRMPGECTISATVDGKTVTCSVQVRSIDPNKFINRINQ